jgi:hypothetical protein
MRQGQTEKFLDDQPNGGISYRVHQIAMRTGFVILT